MNLTNREISQSVKDALDRKNMNIAQCCEAFNVHYKKEIKARKMKPLNKDFVSRVTRNAFKVPSQRILKLCEFLEISATADRQDQLHLLTSQIRQFENQSASDAGFERRYSNLRRFLTGLNLEQMFDDR